MRVPAKRGRPGNQIIDVKEAVQRAWTYFQELMQSGISDIWLEEVELSDDENTWAITLSAFATSRQEYPGAMGAVAVPSRRIYRTFAVDAHTAQVRSMKIRELLER